VQHACQRHLGQLSHVAKCVQPASLTPPLASTDVTTICCVATGRCIRGSRIATVLLVLLLLRLLLRRCLLPLPLAGGPLLACIFIRWSLPAGWWLCCCWSLLLLLLLLLCCRRRRCCRRCCLAPRPSCEACCCEVQACRARDAAPPGTKVWCLVCCGLWRSLARGDQG
jgi:hypothetical protein